MLSSPRKLLRCQYDKRESKARLVEDLEEVALDPLELKKVIQVGSALFGDLKVELVNSLRDQKDMFASLHHDMEGINLSIIVHRLKVDL